MGDIKDNEIMQKNLKCLEKNIPQMYVRLNQYLSGAKQPDAASEENGEIRAFIDVSAAGENIAAVYKDGRNWYLNSRYEAARTAGIWADAFGKIHYKSIFVLGGISNGIYAKKLLERMGDENILIIYEPCAEIFIQAIQNIDMAGILGDKRVGIYVENINMDIFREDFKVIFKYELINYSQIVISPGYGRIFPKELEEFNGLCQKETNFIQGEKNTLVDIGSEMVDNELLNIWRMAAASTIDCLKAHFTDLNIDVENIPAVIVSAGPSLDKNIDELKAAKGHALIIAVDSAIRKCLEHNILPDIIFTIDSHKPLILFEDERIRNIPMVVCGQSRCEIYRNQTGPLFVFADNVFTLRFYNDFGKQISTLKTGGSVANSAFSLARFLGFINIILVGQDLAFTDNKKHASNVYDEVEIGGEEREKYTYVEDMEGKPILTYVNFCIYKEWFEGEIKDHPECRVINSTQGGANIRGAVNMPLHEALRECENMEFDSRCLYEVPYAFSDEELMDVYDMLNDMLSRCDELKSKFDRGIRDYMRFKELIALGRNNTSEFRSIVKKISEVNTMNQEELIIELLSMYSKADEYEVLSKMYDSDENAQNESLKAADQGIELLSVYKKSVDSVKKRLTELINYDISGFVYEVTTYSL